MSLFIKESYVYDLPANLDEAEDDYYERRWVICECGNGRCWDRCENADDEPISLIRFFKVNGVQTCEVCLENSAAEIMRALLPGSASQPDAAVIE